MRADVVIIGGGFAGTSAAITLARANRSVVLVDSHQPRNRFSEHSHGVLGFECYVHEVFGLGVQLLCGLGV